MKLSAVKKTSLYINPTEKAHHGLKQNQHLLLAADNAVNVINLGFSKVFDTAFQEIYLTKELSEACDVKHGQEPPQKKLNNGSPSIAVRRGTWWGLLGKVLGPVLLNLFVSELGERVSVQITDLQFEKICR